MKKQNTNLLFAQICFDILHSLALAEVYVNYTSEKH